MKAAKTTSIVYWVSTGIIFLFEGVMPALTSHTELAVEGIRHLGYPDYFRVMLTVFKVVGALALVLPFIRGRFKEWAYAGFGINMLSASVSHSMVDGVNVQTFFPLFIFGILVVSYLSYHKLAKVRYVRNVEHEQQKQAIVRADYLPSNPVEA
ncbi:DoxX family protein [Pontibacter qinzhouensis]|uniref:DoxX family protein n=1 Tax=Pontibacter qinzhouensis TaxID=2603253 RepID=A0A5C8K9X7_9BACT|nr:DoxX family protein [Pontibacter qinzhouensis]TXK46043.1 DoxX family protein [Pontibacter qinzhouensis]